MGEVIVFEKAKLEDKLKKYEADNWEESDALIIHKNIKYH